MMTVQHSLSRCLWNPWLLVLVILSGLSLPLHAAEDNMEVEYSPFSYTCWQPNTDLSPDNDAIQFNFCYYNDYRLDSWCSGIYIYVDDELVGKMTNMAGDEHDPGLRFSSPCVSSRFCTTSSSPTR